MQAGWIPEIFFDLIGRIVPGILALIALAVTWLGPKEAYRLLSESHDLNDGKRILLFLILSYLSAIVIGQIGWWVRSLRIARTDGPRERKSPGWSGTMGDECVGSKVERIFQDLVDQGPRNSPSARLPMDQCRTQDWILGQIRYEKPAEANRLLKILAEKNLCHVLTAGFSPLVVINLLGAAGMDLWASLQPGLVWRLVLVGLLVICVLALERWRADLDHFLAFALASYWYHQRREEQAQVTDPAATAS